MSGASAWIRALTPSTGSWTLAELDRRRAADAETIGSAVDAIGPDAVAWAVETADRIVTRFRDEGESIGLPGASTGFSRQGAEIGLLTALVTMARDAPLDAVRTAPAMTQLARIAVRQGVPIDALIHKAWASHAASQDEMLDVIGTLVPAERQIDTIRAMSAAMFGYGNATVRALTDAYREERRVWDGRTREERRRLIGQLARGGSVPVDAEAVLGLSLDGGHCFALAFSTSGQHVPRIEEAMDAFARAAARPLGADRVILVPHDAALQIWWTFPDQPPHDAAEILGRARLPEGISLALGPVGVGVEGFRAAYHGANEAARVGRIAQRDGVWDYRDVAHLALLLSDRAASRRFVAHELGGLMDAGIRLAEIRTTLRRYLETGNSRVAVGAELHIAPSTVAYRVAQAEEILGPALRERPLQLLLALQLAHLVPDLAD